jgi:hypothetical protein
VGAGADSVEEGGVRRRGHAIWRRMAWDFRWEMRDSCRSKSRDFAQRSAEVIQGVFQAAKLQALRVDQPAVVVFQCQPNSAATSSSPGMRCRRWPAWEMANSICLAFLRLCRDAQCNSRRL